LSLRRDGPSNELESREVRLTNEAYIIAREAIKATARHEGRLYSKEQESHYFALAVLAALEKAGYVIQKRAAV
jgi:hypothetical protein